MKIFSFDELVSTSTLASQWLETGKHKPPFAVSAASQEQGRGRQGRSWQSPIGNMYLSFAIAADATGLKKLQLLPLKSGLLVADWLLSEYGIHVTLKWPNDILFAGRKLGGILCESTVRGNTIANAVVGLGLNINKAPRISGDYKSISLAEIMQSEFDVEKLVKSLVKYCQDRWLTVNDIETVQRFNDYSFDEGELWKDVKSGEWFVYAGIAADGALMLRRRDDDGELLSITSSQNELRWCIQDKEEPVPLYVCDVGNSKIKIALFSEAGAEEVEQEWSLLSEELTLERLSKLIKLKHVPFYIFSVNDADLQKLMSLLELLNIAAVHLRKRRIYTHGDSYAFANIGADRLAAMEAAVKSLSKPSPVVVVSAGTATTVDLITAEREHLGGWIVPGVETALWSLKQRTAALPDLSKLISERNPKRLGVDTPSAMFGGIMSMHQGLVKEAVQVLAAHAKIDVDQVKVRVTGGFAEWLTSDKKRVRIDPHLILKGIKIIATGGA